LLAALTWRGSQELHDRENPRGRSGLPPRPATPPRWSAAELIDLADPWRI